MPPDATLRRTAARTVVAVPFLLGGILAFAAALDLFRLGARSLWQDEASSVTFAHLSWTTLGKLLWHKEANMALYYGFLHIWIRAWGDSEFALRVPSAVIAVGAVGALYVLGARMFGTRVGLIAALLLAVNAYQVTYAQEARGYTLLVFLVTLSSLVFLRVIERPRATNVIVYTATAVLAVYTHFFGALVSAAQWLSLAFLERRPAVLKVICASAAVMGVLLVPLILVAMETSGQIDWIPKPNARTVYNFLYVVTGAAPTGAKPLLLAYFLAFAGAFVAGIRQFSAAPFSLAAWRYGFLLTWFLAPIALTLGVSTVKPIFVPYYLIIVLPPLALLAAVGLSKITAKLGLAAILFAIVAMATYEDAHYFASPAMEDWRGAAAYAASQLRPGDGVVFDPAYLEKPFDYYRTREFRNEEPAPAAFPWHWDSARIANGEAEIDHVPDAVLRTLGVRYSRIWLFSREGPVDPQLLTTLRTTYVPTVEKSFGAVRVALYSHPK